VRRLLLCCLALAASGHAFADVGLLERLVGAFSRDSLWKHVQERCLVPATPTHTDCVIVDRQRGFVLYKDAIGASHYLVIPDQPVGGVEDPRVWSDGKTHSAWTFGWQARDIVAKSIGKPLPDPLVGLAINARASRSQDQLHIHLDCISDRARDFLTTNKIGTQWTDLSFQGKPVRAMLIPSAQPTLTVDPFDVVRQSAGGKEIADRGVFVGYIQPPGGVAGFVVVDEPVDKAAGGNGHASDFLDRGCKLGRALPSDG